MHETDQLLLITREAGRRAADHIRSAAHPGDPATWDVKGTSNFATQVDRDAESVIAETVMAAYPDCRVLGEELTPEEQGAGLTWIVDPLDGTTNFLHGYPAYAVSIAASIDGVLQTGVVIDVPHDVTYWGTAGGGAWRDGQRLHVSRIDEPRFALVGTGFPFKAPDLLPGYQRQLETILRSTSGVRRAGSAALDLVHVASGFFDAFWELSLAPWDVAAGTLIAREAGAVVTDLTGDTNVLRQGPIVAGNPTLHRWLLAALND